MPVAPRLSKPRNPDHALAGGGVPRELWPSYARLAAEEVACMVADGIVGDATQRRAAACGVPILTEAIGLELAPAERRYVRWLAGWDKETVDTFVGLFLRVRNSERDLSIEAAAALPNNPPDDPTVVIELSRAEYVALRAAAFKEPRP